MRAKLTLQSYDCPCCGSAVYPSISFTGDSEPYIEEHQKNTFECDHCESAFEVSVMFTATIDKKE